EAAEFNPVIIAESTTTLERLSVSEAVIELDMTGAPVVIFRHAVTGRVNIVYRRGDRNIGWIDPPEPQREGLATHGKGHARESGASSKPCRLVRSGARLIPRVLDRSLARAMTAVIRLHHRGDL